MDGDRWLVHGFLLEPMPHCLVVLIGHGGERLGSHVPVGNAKRRADMTPE